MKSLSLLAAAAALLLASAAHAGPVIIDGTDANDHGFASQGANRDGWLYMQRAFENLASNVTPTAARVVDVIGTAAGEGTAFDAIQSAFSLSSLASSGWTIRYHNGVPAINSFMGSLSTATTGILHLTTANLASGDMTTGELQAVNNFSANINNFVGGLGNAALGGALFAMGETGNGEFGWLSALIPTITSVDIGGGGLATDITLTAAGASAFPGLTNADLGGADPWHGYFAGDLGGLSVLGSALQGGVQRAVIIGGGTGTIFQCGQPGQPACPNNAVSEPGSVPLVAVALAGIVAASRRRKPRVS
jgi:hypothetical protein